MGRYFFAVWPDEAAAKALHRVAREARKACGGRLMKQESLHLTLAFLGSLPSERVEEAMRVADTIAAAPFAPFAPFDISLDHVAYWRHNRILWAGGNIPPLTALAGTLTQGLREAGFQLDARPFAAHMTLLRDARCDDAPDQPAPVVWRASEFVLAESRTSPEGSQYEIVGHWPLRKEAE